VPEISRFFGIVVRMFFNEHNPPHVHVEFQDGKAVFDLAGNITHGGLKSRTAVRLVREWIDVHVDELRADWELARAGRELNRIVPLD
jgi:hypothetical protein